MSNQHNYFNRVSVIGKVLEKKRLVRCVNLDKAKEDNKKYVAKHRLDNPQKAVDATSTAVQKFRQCNPAYSKAQNRRLVSAYYHKNAKQSRLLSCTSTARHLMKHLQTTCLKSRLRYLLVEPTNQEVNRLMTTVADEILEGLKTMVLSGTLKNMNPLKCPHVN